MIESRFDSLYRTLPRKAALTLCSLGLIGTLLFSREGIVVEKDSPAPTAEYKAEQTGHRFVEFPRNGTLLGLPGEVARFCADLGMGVKAEADSIICSVGQGDDALLYPIGLGRDEIESEARQSNLNELCMNNAGGSLDKVAPDKYNKDLEDLVWACELEG